MPERTVAHRIIGTAGHIDHGKTALVRALTGVDTDRLPEEQRRGITIELGFASWPLAADVHASVIDVPGHERFVRTMVAGAAGIDLVLLVVAADDGVMPQTREHLAVCELLGVQRGLVVISKTDLVDDDMLALVREDVAASVQGSFLEGAPVLACSALTGAGIDALREATLGALRETSPREGVGPAFLAIDRSFTRPGFGTVVTGTLLSGHLALGDEVDVVPGPRTRPLLGAKVRGLQVHGASVDDVSAGTRVAANLRGAEHDEVGRGDVVVSAGSRSATTSLLVELRSLPDAPPIKERDQLSLHVGTKGALATVLPLGTKTLDAGSRGYARLTTTEPLVAFADQRVVLRKPGLHGQGTIAGGRVLDPAPSGGKGAHARWAETAPRLAGARNVEERLLALLADARSQGVVEPELCARCPPGSDVRAALAALERAGRALLVDAGQRRFVDARLLADLEQQVLALTREFHEERPLVLGISPREIETRLPPPARVLAGAALERLCGRKALVREEGLVRLASHQAAGPGRALLEKLERVYEGARLKPPLDEEARQSLGVGPKELRDALGELKRQGRLQRLGDLHFHVSALDDVRARVERYFAGASELSTAQFKDLAGGVSRKYAIPLLEWLDSQGATRRQGDVRTRGR